MMRHRWYPNAAIQASYGAEPLFDSGFNFTDYHNTRRMVGVGGLELLDAQELESTHYAYSSAYTVDVRTHELRLLMEYDAAALPESTMVLAAEVHRRALAAIVEGAERSFHETPLPGIADLARLLASGPAADATGALAQANAPTASSVPVTAAPSPVATAEPKPDRTAVEAGIREIWTEVLGVTDIDAHTPFFDAGGDSLTAMQVVSRLRARHGDLSMRAFMAEPTIRGLANLLGGATAPTTPATTPAVVESAARYPPPVPSVRCGTWPGSCLASDCSPWRARCTPRARSRSPSWSGRSPNCPPATRRCARGSRTPTSARSRWSSRTSRSASTSRTTRLTSTRPVAASSAWPPPPGRRCRWITRRSCGSSCTGSVRTGT